VYQTAKPPATKIAMIAIEATTLVFPDLSFIPLVSSRWAIYIGELLERISPCIGKNMYPLYRFDLLS
jgi:hypothetical protein